MRECLSHGSQMIFNKLERGIDGSGFVCEQAEKNFEREIELLKFKIARRDQIRNTTLSAFVGALVDTNTAFVVNKVF